MSDSSYADLELAVAAQAAAGNNTVIDITGPASVVNEAQQMLHVAEREERRHWRGCELCQNAVRSCAIAAEHTLEVDAARARLALARQALDELSPPWPFMDTFGGIGMMGTRTGRLQSAQPNIMNMPKPAGPGGAQPWYVNARVKVR